MFAASFDSKMGCLYSVFDAKKQGNQFGWSERGIGSSEEVKTDFRVWGLRLGLVSQSKLESKWLWVLPYMIHGYDWYGIGKRNEILALRGAFLKPCNGLERGIPQALLRS
ncbi:hypothetical protein GQ457_14G001780 [Hibiscus cannabinus]